MHNLCNYLIISTLASGAMPAVCCKHHVFELSGLFFEFFELLPNNCLFFLVCIYSVCVPVVITYATDEDSCIAAETFG